jgi:hypothetical protein
MGNKNNCNFSKGKSKCCTCFNKGNTEDINSNPCEFCCGGDMHSEVQFGHQCGYCNTKNTCECKKI